MFLGDLNLFIIFFFLIFFTLFININSSIHLLLTAELLWIALYAIALFVGFVFDNINVLSLTFFFLVLSAVEFGIGLVLLLFQNIIFRSINLNDFDLNFSKFIDSFLNKLYVNKLKWKI